MSAPHFLLENVDSDVLELTGEEARHAARALRVVAGERVTVTDGHGTVVEGIVVDVGATVRIEAHERRTASRATPAVRMCPAVPKKGKLDLIVEKLTELGASRISPWFAARSVVGWDERKRRAQGERLRAIARSATKQSRRAWIPSVDDPGELVTQGVVVVLDPGASSPLRDVLPGTPPAELTVVLGPEGGFHPDELDGLLGVGALPATLGEAVLRAETAAIASCVLVMRHFHLLG